MEESIVKSCLLAAQEHRLDDFASLYPQIFKWVFGIAMRILRDEGKAEEVAAEIVAGLYLDPPDYDHNQRATSYVAKMVFNKCMDIFRRERLLSGDLDGVLQHAAFQIPANQLKEIEKQELFAAIDECLGLLPKSDRTAIIIRCFAIAIPENKGKKISQDKWRGIKKLRDCLRAKGYRFSDEETDR
jgi:RNA polymerase sigma factor (sigma-70 family)